MGAFDVSYGAAALAGLISFLSPCVLPLVPAYICFVAGTSLDKLIDQARSTMDREKRKKMLYQVFKMIADDVPYVFFFNRKFSLYAHTKRMERVKDTYKYGVGTPYWWISK